MKNVELTENRAEWVDGAQGERILSDVYNSNPTAAKQVLKTIEELPTTGKRIAVLGDMLELGDASARLHASLAANIDPKKIEEVCLVGSEMENLQDALEKRGYPASAIHHYSTAELDKLVADLQATISADDLVLLKASHGIHLEKVLAKLTTK